MCSPCLRTERWPARVLAAALAAFLVLTVTACRREQRDYAHKGPPTTPAAEAVRVGDLQAGTPQPAYPDPVGRRFEGNAWHVNQGQKLYKSFNCNGCHASGGGGIGPALMDADWRYGGSIEQIHATIAQGRPNGMPSFRGKLPDDQVWEIAAYVRTLSGNGPKYVAGGASEGMTAKPTRIKTQEPRTTEPSL